MAWTNFHKSNVFFSSKLHKERHFENSQKNKDAIIENHFSYMCRTPKCDETLKSDGHAKVRRSAPNPDGLTRQSPMVRVQSPKYEDMIRQSSMVFKYNREQRRKNNMVNI